MFLLCVIIFACANKQTLRKHESKSTSSSKVEVNTDIVYDSAYLDMKRTAKRDSQLDLSTFKKYQTFDEYNMKPVGKPKRYPYVFVCQLKDTIIVVAANKKQRVVTYVRHGKLWYSHEHLDLDDIDRERYKCRDSYEKYPRSYYRINGNDSIIEYCYTYFNRENGKVKELYVKTRKQCFLITFKDDKNLANINNIFTDMLCFANQLKNNKYRAEENKEYFCSEYEVTENGKYYVLTRMDNDVRLYFEKNALGTWNLQPGFDNYNRKISVLSHGCY